MLLVTLPARLGSAITLEEVRLSGLVVDAAQEPERGDWVGARANIDVPRSARGVTVHLRFAAPAPQTVAVSLDGRAVENVQGQPGQVLELRYMLPHAGPKAKFRRLGLAVSPTWTPPGSGAELGLVIESVEWTP